MKYKQTPWFVAVLLASTAALFGCSSQTEGSSQTGQLSLALSATGPSGVTYGLVGELIVSGPESFVASLDPADDGFARLVNAGLYDVLLADGFTLVNLDTGEPEALAVLLSPNPNSVDVPANGVGSLVLTFAVPGGEVTFETGTLDVGLEVIEGLPDGALCDVDTDCASGLCSAGICEDGTGGAGGTGTGGTGGVGGGIVEPPGGTGGVGGGIVEPPGGTGGVGGGVVEPPVDPAAETFAATVNCQLPLGLGAAVVDLQVNVDPQSEWSVGTSSEVDVQAQTVIPASLGQLLLGLGTNTLTIAELVAELGVDGGSPSPITVVIENETYELDPDGDGNANDLQITIPVPTTTITSNNSPELAFSVAHFVVTVSNVPLVGTLTLSDTAPPATSDPCDLVSGAAVFPNVL